MNAIRHSTLTTVLVGALLAPSAASAVLLPIDPVTKSPSVRKQAKPQRAHVPPVRKKPPLQP